MTRSNRVPDGYKASGVDVGEADAGLRNIIARVTATWPQSGLGAVSVLCCGLPLRSAAEHCSESEIRSPASRRASWLSLVSRLQQLRTGGCVSLTRQAQDIGQCGLIMLFKYGPTSGQRGNPRSTCREPVAIANRARRLAALASQM